MRDFWTKIKAVFTKDTAGEGESIKLLVALRVLFAEIIIYLLVGTVFCLHIKHVGAALCFVGVLAVFALMFYSSYYVKTIALVVIANILSVACIVTGYFLVGPSALLQEFFIVIVVVCYFSGYGHYITKGIFTAVLCAIQYILQMYYRNVAALLPFSVSELSFLKFINILAAFCCVATICYMYSKDSQHLEGKLIEYNKMLRQQASTDTLTGLSNRRSANEYIEKLIKRNDEKGFCVCMCDIDFFKKVNDSYGHDIGDKVLAGVAQMLVDNVTSECLVSRWGGEEFLIIFPNMNGDEAKSMLDIIRARIKKMEFDTGSKTFGITITYGLAEYGFDGNGDALVKEADSKLYIGKENGRDQIVF